MIDFIVACICLIIAWQIILLRRAYFAKPVYEVKRQAMTGNGFARLIYPIVAYGPTVRAMLWLVLGAVMAIALVLLSKLAPVWLGICLVAIWLWLAFSWMPNRRVGALSREAARMATPILIWFLNWSYPVMRYLEKLTGHYLEPHTGIYESEDLHRLLRQTAKQPDSRISEDELHGIKQLLDFKTATVAQYVEPWKRIMKVAEDEAISPKMLDELHKSGRVIFPVMRSKTIPQPTGWLYWEDVGLKSQGAVKTYMRSSLHYVNETDTLKTALSIFSLSGATMLLVVNTKEKVVGTLSLKDTLKALISLDSKVNIADTEDIKRAAAGSDKLAAEDEA